MTLDEVQRNLMAETELFCEAWHIFLAVKEQSSKLPAVTGDKQRSPIPSYTPDWLVSATMTTRGGGKKKPRLIAVIFPSFLVFLQISLRVQNSIIPWKANHTINCIKYLKEAQGRIGKNTGESMMLMEVKLGWARMKNKVMVDEMDFLGRSAGEYRENRIENK